jgi:predicted nucleotidyltransferase
MAAILALTREIADRLERVEGVVTVVLGGSWARGDVGPVSDIDLAIYYEPDRPPSIDALRRLARELDDRHAADLVTNFGGWGPWINGGGWLTIGGRAVDWLYRDLARVRRVIAECRDGRPTYHPQPGHPAGFHSHIYLGEVYYCRPLRDPTGAMAALKTIAAVYPPLLRRVLIDTYLWQAGFALNTGRKGAERDDPYYVTGSLFQCASCLVQVLFALNQRYYINEKGSVRTVDSFPLRPDGFGDTVMSVLAHPGETTQELSDSIERLAAAVRATEELCIICLKH